jgi:uncharacterized membrane protein YbhN (UPF0104 family)
MISTQAMSELDNALTDGGRRLTAKRMLILVLEIALATFVVHHLWQQRAELSAVWSLGLAEALALIALVVAGVAVRAWEFRYVLARLGADISFVDAVALIQGATLLNYAPFNAGTLLRARALKRHRSLSYTNYIAMMSAQLIVLALASGVLGLVSLLGADLDRGVYAFAALCALAILGSLVAFRIPPTLFGSGNGWFRERMQALLAGWQQIGREPRELLILSSAAIAKLVDVGLRFWIAFDALGMTVTLPAAVVFASVSSLMLLVNVIPGSLGVRELLVGALATVAGLGFTETVAAASVDRVASLIVAFGIGVPSLVYLRRRSLM